MTECCSFCESPKHLVAVVTNEDTGIVACEWCWDVLQSFANLNPDLREYHAEAITRHGKPKAMKAAVREARRIMEGRT